jgi:hypothetical protein
MDEARAVNLVGAVEPEGTFGKAGVVVLETEVRDGPAGAEPKFRLMISCAGWAGP